MRGRRPKANNAEQKVIQALDERAEFERFRENILPIFRQAVAEQWTAEKIWSHPLTQAMLAANAVRIGLDNSDPGKALAAITAVMDRTVGKPTEKQEVTHKVQGMKDEELNALLATHMADLGLAPDDTKH